MDAWIREKVFQRIADKIADRGGPNCFRLAATALECMVASFVATQAIRIVAAMSSVMVSVVAFLLVMLPFGIVARRDAVAEAARFEAGNWQPRITYWNNPVYRAAPSAFMLLDLGRLIDAIAEFGPFAPHAEVWAFELAWDVAWLSWAYFMVCLPKPPRRQRAPALPPTIAWLGAK